MPTSPQKKHKRVIHLSGRDVISYGMHTHLWQDFYYYAMTFSWPIFFGVFALLFVCVNIFFAGLYMLGDQAIGNMLPNNFIGAFFFSVETLATVGYGDMHPQTIYGHFISTTELFVGMTGIALMTGLIFARFSRPRSSIIFANHPVCHTEKGQATLMIRIANSRLNVISEASAKLRLIWDEETSHQRPFRKILDLRLEREEHPIFILGWTLLHVIDEHSPLFGQTLEMLKARDAALILSVSGVDETANQTQHAHQYYRCEQIRWNHRYVDMFHNENGALREIHFSRMHETQEVDAILRDVIDDSEN